MDKEFIGFFCWFQSELPEGEIQCIWWLFLYQSFILKELILTGGSGKMVTLHCSGKIILIKGHYDTIDFRGGFDYFIDKKQNNRNSYQRILQYEYG